MARAHRKPIQSCTVRQGPQESAVTVRTYHTADLDAVLRFYSSALGDDGRQKRDGFRWIQRNPLLVSDAPNYLLMFSNEQIVAYWGLMPTRFYCSGAPFPGVFSQEALVYPPFRGTGLGHLLLNEVNARNRFMLSLWHNEKIQAIKTTGGWLNLGLHQPLKKVYTLKGLAATAWRQDTVGKLCSYMSPIPALLSEKKRTATVGYVVQQDVRCSLEYDEFFHEIAHKLGIVAERSSSILNWKYVDIPHKHYTMLSVRKSGALRGYLVLRIENQPHLKKGLIVDLLTDPDEPVALEALLNGCERIFEGEDVDFSVCVVQPEAMRKVLSSKGYFSSGSRSTDSCLILNPYLTADPRAVTDLASWYITYGDSDGDMW